MLLPSLYLLLTCIDAFYTCFMLGKYGVGIERNPLIPFLVRYLGLVRGTVVGIFGPTIGICIIGYYFHPLIETLLFARLILFFMQAQHLRSELLWHSVKKIAHSS